MKLRSLPIVIAALVIGAGPTNADPPNLQTPAPVIYLADNLDEKDDLGWCIDTLGRGFAERLQAHSCKPQGGDVQFALDPTTGLIQSVEFNEYCMVHRPNEESTFALANCDAAAVDQQFIYDVGSRTIRTKVDQSACVTVGENSRSAGPFMSRTLILTACSETEAALKEWVIVEE